MYTKSSSCVLLLLDIGYRSPSICDEVMESSYLRDREEITEVVEIPLYYMHNKNTFDLIHVSLHILFSCVKQQNQTMNQLVTLCIWLCSFNLF